MLFQLKKIHSYHIGAKEPENTSSHVKVSCYLSIATPIARKQNTKSVKKFQWAKVDRNLFEQILREEIQKDGRMNEKTVDWRLEELAKMLPRATESAAPYKLIKLKGTTWRASPTVKELLATCKQKHKLWIDRRKTDEILRKDSVLAKRKLRKQLRKEKFDDRKNFYEELMQNPH